MNDDELDSLISAIEMEPKLPAAGQGLGRDTATPELSIDDIDAFMADLNVGGASARAQATKVPVIKRKSKYTAAGAAAGPELDSLLENLDPKSVDLTKNSKGICTTCKNHIIGDSVTCMNKVYHPEHIYCSNCGCRDADNKYFEKDGAIVCSNCLLQKTGIYCRGCNKGILSVSVDALDAQWHPECFNCSKCRGAFVNGKYAVRDGKPVCEPCAAATQYCRSCKKLIEGPAISALGGFFHKTGGCFACQTCTKAVGPGFCTHEGLPYCETHYLEKMGIPICAHCNRPISGPFMNALNKKWHSDHFMCTLCMSPLGANFLEDNGKPYCHSCSAAI